MQVGEDPWRPTADRRFIRRNRAPRVHITYEDPYDAERQIELPFVMGVMSDLSGNNSERREAGSRGAQVPRLRHGQFREPHGGDRAGRRRSRSTTSSATAPARSCRSTCTSRRWTTSARPRSRARCRRSPSCWRRASSSPICCATWTARWRPRISSRSCLQDPQLMAALREGRACRPARAGESETDRQAITHGDQPWRSRQRGSARRKRSSRRAIPTNSRPF